MGANYLLNPLIHGVSGWKRASPAGDCSRAIGCVSIRDVVPVQHGLLIKLDEECINNILSLELQKKEGLFQILRNMANATVAN